MKVEIKVPPMGESISEASIGTFLKKNGSAVKEGEEIVEIETEKVNQPLYAPANGEINWSVSEGDTVTIGTVLGFVDTEKAGEEKTVEPPKEEAPPPKKAAGEIRQTTDAFIGNLEPPKEEKKVEEPKPSGERESR